MIIIIIIIIIIIKIYNSPFLNLYATPVFLDVRYNYFTTDVVVKF